MHEVVVFSETLASAISCQGECMNRRIGGEPPLGVVEDVRYRLGAVRQQLGVVENLGVVDLEVEVGLIARR